MGDGCTQAKVHMSGSFERAEGDQREHNARAQMMEAALVHDASEHRMRPSLLKRTVRTEGGGRVRLARHGLDVILAVLQEEANNGAALRARGAGDDDDLLVGVRHDV